MLKDTAAEMGKLGHRAKNGTNGHPGRTVIFFRDTLLKIGTVPENLGCMVTLIQADHFHDSITIISIYVRN